jgi:hypothetical protein
VGGSSRVRVGCKELCWLTGCPGCRDTASACQPREHRLNGDERTGGYCYRICWIIPVRPFERFHVRLHTKSVITLTVMRLMWLSSHQGLIGGRVEGACVGAAACWRQARQSWGERGLSGCWMGRVMTEVCDNGCRRRRQTQANQITDATINKPSQQTSLVIGNLATRFSSSREL